MMKDTTRSKAAATTPLPTFQQMVGLALTKAEQSLRRLIDIRCSDENWEEADVDVDFAVELALTHLERMKAMSFSATEDFVQEWFKVAAALSMGKKLFSRPDCWYGQGLDGACGMFEQMAILVEFVTAGSAQ